MKKRAQSLPRESAVAGRGENIALANSLFATARYLAIPLQKTLVDPPSITMYVIKRNGSQEEVSFDKILDRLRILCNKEPHLPKRVDPTLVAQKVIQGIYAGVKTSELDNLAAETAAYMSTIHPGYGELGARIAVSNLHRETVHASFADVMEAEYANQTSGGIPSPLVSDELIGIVRRHRDLIESAINYNADYSYDYFGFKTLAKGYLVRIDDVIVERPQDMLMRVALGIHGENDLDNAMKTYRFMSQGYFIHATPTLFNAGTPTPQMSSCFLLGIKSDSIEGIYDTLKQTALISKCAGGVGVAISNVRASGSYIRGSNGTSNGLVPMLRVFNDTARYVDQGGGKRKGAFAVYLEPWHADIKDFLQMKKNHGKEEQRARDLFYGLWIPDLFMRRVEEGGDWSLFCPNDALGLEDCHGVAFDDLYAKYESDGIAREVVKARDLWNMIVDAQIETGTPYMLYKDAINRKSNQSNLGTIRCSNLCTEITEYTSKDEVAVCNLASVALPKFVSEDGCFDYIQLYEVVRHMTRNLNRVIDRNHYPVPEASRSNMRHRPIGLGIQGLADVFIKMKIAFESEAAAEVNVKIMETIYFAALTASNEMSKRDGPYETYKGSPASKGILQHDMWGVSANMWGWSKLRADIAQYGLRNSLLVAPMPTASTSQILGNNECFEPYTSNIYVRRVLAGEFCVLNKHLVADLMEIDMWNETVKNKIIADGGSVQSVEGIPESIKSIYKTVWEMKLKTLIDMAADRGAFVDQSQSMNVFMEKPTRAKLNSMHFYGWKRGLKTGMYYLRTKPAASAIQFTVDVSKAADVSTTAAPSLATNEAVKQDEADGDVCRMEEGCLVCSS